MPDLRKKLEDALTRTGNASSDFDLNADVAAPDIPLTPAGVLVGIHADTESVILTKRSARLKHHPGQIAFPGGKQDPGDATVTDAALREAHEEIGLPKNFVEVLGTLPPHQTVTGYQVTPIVGLITGAFDPVAEVGEVSEIFEVPLAHLMDPTMYRVEGRQWQGRKRFYYVVPFGPYYVWGEQRGLLNETLVVWGGEFGRTPFAQGKNGRDHNPYGFTMWMAGGGVKGGHIHGSTDEYGYKVIENRVEIHDLHATMLHLLGVDHTRQTFRFSGRDMRLTDVHGHVVHDIIA